MTEKIHPKKKNTALAVLRMLRVFRVLRLFKRVPWLKILFNAIIGSLYPGFGLVLIYIQTLYINMLYIYMERVPWLKIRFIAIIGSLCLGLPMF